MSDLSLSEVKPDMEAFYFGVKNAKICVEHGRHFTLILNDAPKADQVVVSATMKEIVAYWKTFKPMNANEKTHLNILRDRIIVLDFQANAKLKNNNRCGAQFEAWLRRLFGGTSGKNYHIDQLVQLEKSPNPINPSILKAAYLGPGLSEADEANGRMLDGLFQKFVRISIRSYVCEASKLIETEEGIKFNNKLKEKLKKARGEIHTKIADKIQPMSKLVNTYLDEVRDLTLDEQRDLLLEIVKNRPNLVCTVSTRNEIKEAEMFAALAKNDELNRIVVKTFEKLDRMQKDPT